MTTVLVTCSGIRVDLVEELQRLGAKVVCADAWKYAPTLWKADEGYVVPRADSSLYVPRLLEICRVERVHAVVSVADHDLVELAKHQARFPCPVLISPAPVVALMWDKWLAHERFVELGLPAPRAWLPMAFGEVEPRFPVMVKERCGTAGKNVTECPTFDSVAELLYTATYDAMIEEKCRGQEYSVDVFSDMHGRVINVVPRIMHQLRGGETIVGETVKDSRLIEFGAELAEKVGLRGPTMAQFFDDPDGLLITDVNPRFGAGMIPSTIAANAGYVEKVLAIARGEELEPELGSFDGGVVFSRFWQSVVLERAGDGALRRRA